MSADAARIPPTIVIKPVNMRSSLRLCGET
jgi:hypothetical protein